jgi:uncharacterized membrane protein YfcA
VVLYGMPVHVAVATSQVTLAVTAAVAAGLYAMSPVPAIDGSALLWTGLGAAVGAQGGAMLAPRVAAAKLKVLLAVVLLVVAAAMAAEGLGVKIRGG